MNITKHYEQVHKDKVKAIRQSCGSHGFISVKHTPIKGLASHLNIKVIYNNPCFPDNVANCKAFNKIILSELYGATNE